MGHLGHLSHNCIKTRCNNVHQPIWLNFFWSFQNNFGLSDLKKNPGMYFFSVLACSRKHYSVPLHANACLKTPALLAFAKFELVYVLYSRLYSNTVQTRFFKGDACKPSDITGNEWCLVLIVVAVSKHKYYSVIFALEDYLYKFFVVPFNKKV